MNFFFDNPFLAIILIAVISSFFKKKKEDSAQKQGSPKQLGNGHKPRPLNPFEEARELFKELASSVSEETKPISKKTREKTVRQLKRSAETAASNLVRAERTSIGLQDVVPETAQEADTPAALTPGTTSQKKLEVRENQVIDAIIWSEILGPPRAKKPYMRNNFRS
ncbi:hypothetical protein [Bacillus benzoevorans]|uniref:Uncharacterized protein n=1 Tax=Bacillus benzoevorans TaxID=1456 RepID=A0A7X0HU75_9BACI|nr:hypothetical protein [Bacillus benzoevorans]MBB6445982.1 hypothetical protein [Bacillus benzoevorans]